MSFRTYVRKVSPTPLPNTHLVSHTTSTSTSTSANAHEHSRNLFSLLINTIAECTTSTASASPIDGSFEDSNIGMRFAHRWKRLIEERRRSHATINALPDNVLLKIFDFYRMDPANSVGYMWAWHKLIQVCRRWRSVIFASPRYLHLRLVCRSRTPVRRTLDVWPALPIGIQAHPIHKDGENIIAALEHHDRVSWIELGGLTNSQLGRFVAAMQKPFPNLKYLSLELELYDDIAPVVTDAFLAGSSPRLRAVLLNGIPFPTLPKLLLTANDLVNLQLRNIPVTGYISPELLATCLSSLTRLRFLSIRFQSPRSFPNRTSQRLPLRSRAVLPALTRLHFQGVSEYLEELVARIEAPLLNDTIITFFNQLVFETPQLSQFIRRTEKLTILTRAKVTFYSHSVKIALYAPVGPAKLELQVSCNDLEWQISSMEQICTRLSPLLSPVERLEFLEGPFLRPEWQDDMDSTQWLELLDPFTAVQSLHVSEELEPLVAPALQELTGRRAAEVLPALRTIFFGGLQKHGSVQEVIEPFIAARQLSDNPVSVQCWYR